MRSNAGMANRHGDVDLRVAQISASSWHFGLAWLGLAWLEVTACRKRHNNLDSLKRSLVKAAAEIPLETVRTAIAEWPECLKACVGAEGGLFECHYYN